MNAWPKLCAYTLTGAKASSGRGFGFAEQQDKATPVLDVTAMRGPTPAAK